MLICETAVASYKIKDHLQPRHDLDTTILKICSKHNLSRIVIFAHPYFHAYLLIDVFIFRHQQWSMTELSSFDLRPLVLRSALIAFVFCTSCIFSDYVYDDIIKPHFVDIFDKLLPLFLGINLRPGAWLVEYMTPIMGFYLIDEMMNTMSSHSQKKSLPYWILTELTD